MRNKSLLFVKPTFLIPIAPNEFRKWIYTLFLKVFEQKIQFERKKIHSHFEFLNIT